MTNEKVYTRVLIVGNSFIPDTGGGVTRTNLFNSWPKNKLAVANEIVTDSDRNFCNYSYQLDSPFVKKTEYNNESFKLKKNNNNVNFKRRIKDILKPIYQLPYMYSKLKGMNFKINIEQSFLEWINEFKPQIIYCMVYKLYHIPFLIELKKRTNVPLAIHIVDDWVNTKQFGILNFFWKKIINTEFRKLIDKSDVLMSISSEMQKAYHKQYGRNFIPFHNPINLNQWKNLSRTSWKIKHKTVIMFAGTVCDVVIKELELLCKIINKNKLYNMFELNIYGSFRDEKDLINLKKYKGVNIKGLVNHDNIIKLLPKHDILFLPLSFDKKISKTIILSMPTKVSEYMMSGTPIIVFAPNKLALTKYAINHNWAFIVTKNRSSLLLNAITKLKNNINLREKLGRKAIEVATEKHDSIKIQEKFFNVLNEGI